MTELSRFRINTSKVIHETIDGETVIVNLDSGSYYSLDATGADIWGLIDGCVNVVGIVEWVAGRYRGDRGEIEKAVYQFMNELQQEALIVIDETGESWSDADHSGCYTVNPGQHSEDFVSPVLHKYTDMQDLLLLDPIHDVDEAGWPSSKDDLSVGSQ
ncbi:MAG TPA: PqqD family protein [Thermodesulfovibrionales bacterium]|nr:PqqD family protein [Thermodesulfovibrionales bacterium]